MGDDYTVTIDIDIVTTTKRQIGLHMALQPSLAD